MSVLGWLLSVTEQFSPQPRIFHPVYVCWDDGRRRHLSSWCWSRLTNRLYIIEIFQKTHHSSARERARRGQENMQFMRKCYCCFSFWDISLSGFSSSHWARERFSARQASSVRQDLCESFTRYYFTFAHKGQPWASLSGGFSFSLMNLSSATVLHPRESEKHPITHPIKINYFNNKQQTDPGWMKTTV